MDFKGRPGDRPDRSSKLSALASAGLGHLVDKRSVEGLAEMQARLQTRQVELAQLVMTGKISREKYIKELDEAMRQAAKTGESLLGVDDFHKVFGKFRAHNWATFRGSWRVGPLRTITEIYCFSASRRNSLLPLLLNLSLCVLGLRLGGSCLL
jgi:hypothetical protein